MTSPIIGAQGLDAVAHRVLANLPRIRERHGVLFLAMRADNRLAVATTIERLINHLDAFDGDPDLEPSLGVPNEARLDDFDWWEYDDRERDDTDLEPSGDELDASFPEDRRAACISWNEDDEDADPAGGDVQDEPHDDGGFGHSPDHESSLGWPEQIDQSRRAILAQGHRHDDGEEDGGDMPEGGDEREDDRTDLTGFGWADDAPNISQDGPHFCGYCGQEPTPAPGGAW